MALLVVQSYKSQKKEARNPYYERNTIVHMHVFQCVYLTYKLGFLFRCPEWMPEETQHELRRDLSVGTWCAAKC